MVYAFLLLSPTQVLPKERLLTYAYPRTFRRISTMTCCTCKCYHEHPPGIHLTRLTVLVISFIMRFIAFILGSLCATKFNPICVPYTVFSSLSLVPTLITLTIEMFHFHVFWNHQPLLQSDQLLKRPYGFLRFFPFNMMYDQRCKEYGMTADDIGCQCGSVCISHTILYHSATRSPPLPLPPLIDGKVIIAYHLTSIEKATDILKNGFPLGKKKQIADDIVFYLHVPSTTTVGVSNNEVIICARLCMDHVLQVNDSAQFTFDKHGSKTPEPKGLELLSAERKVKVKYPRQIEKWIVIFQSDIIDTIHPSGYQGLL